MGIPTGTVTFLFTDLVDSSRLWDLHPVQMRTALERHDSLLRGAIAEHLGYVFTTAGDSFAAAFETADAAAGAALTIHHTISEEPWPSATPMSVRIGLHTGEAHERDGDYYGPAVNRAARVESAGHAGQTLVSSTTADVLAGSTASTWHVTPLGMHLLSGISHPQLIHQLDATDRHVDFGALSTGRLAATNLVGHQPELIGRDDTLEILLALVKERHLVTVTGVGGVGKTSLAIAAGHRALAEFDEVWFVELASATTRSAVTAAVSKTAGIAGSPSHLDEVSDALARRGQTLVVLDNCEHVVESAAAIADALEPIENVTVLTTSRLELEATREQVLRLEPLGTGHESVELFVREARRRSPEFEAVGSDLRLVEEICAAVDGIPLAVELAGAATRSISLRELLPRLDEVLTTARRRQRGDPRHATMTAAIEWSIGLLDRDIASALGACTVFGRTFDLEGAEAVLPVVTGTTPRVVIDELVAQSLIEMARADDGVRYRLLEPVRQYAAANLLQSAVEARDAHMDHYLGRLERAYGLFCTTTCEPMLQIVFHDIDNLRAVHDWALATDRIDEDLRLYRPLGVAMLHSIHDPADWAIETIQAADLDGLRGAVAAFRMATRVTVERDHVSSLLGELIERHRRLVAHPDDDDIQMAARASAARYRGDYERAVEIWKTIETEDPMVVMSRFHEGAFALGACADDPASAVAEWLANEEAWADSIGARNAHAVRLGFRGYIEVTFGDPQRAFDLLDEAHALASSMRMYDRSITFRVDRVRALLLGATGPVELHEELRDALRESAHLRVGICVRFALDVAARVLAGHADPNLVELCDTFGYVALPWGDRTEPSPPEIDAARVERSHGGLSVYDVAELAAEALDAIIAAGVSEPSQRSSWERQLKGRRSEISLIGPVAAMADGHVVDIGGERPRRLLAALAVASPEAVSADRLADIVWQGAPPPSAAKTLQVYISRLRSVLAVAELGGSGGVIRRVGPGYVLDVDSGRIDVNRLEEEARTVDRLREVGAHSDAVAAIDRALGVWRGPPLMDFAEEDWARGIAQRLTEMRVLLLEHRVEALIASGHAALAVGDAEALINEQPLRERPLALLMRALVAAGRRPEALRAYQDFHRLLGEELGLTPSAELRSLEVEISTESSAGSPARVHDEPTGALRPDRASRRPSGTVTFLFTDVVDSSRLWDRFPIEMRTALERHDEILRSAIETHGGYVFTTAGDSFAAAFSAADGAAGAALRIHELIAGELWSDETPIRVRIGIHTGETHERGGDYYGPAVNRAARLEAAGHGGQTLVSATTADVLAGSTAHRWSLTPLGEYRLKGLSEPEVIHQLDWFGREVDFGPLATGRLATTNLRGHPPELIGRSDDLCDLEELLTEHGLVTVTGVGGVGKTSLARAVAHNWSGRADEVWFVELAPVSDASMVASRLSKTVGIAGAPSDVGRICEVLSRRGSVLVVLDNCEHVIGPAAVLAEGMAGLDNVTVLATTRLEMEVPGERVLRLGPLGVSDPSAELFVREARRRTPGFEVLEGDRAVIEAICQAVDGIPLAIELAAAKTRSIDVAQILDRLDVVLGTAARRSRADDRHATMTAAIDWSIDLLHRDSAVVMGALTVFAGTFDLTAVTDILARLGEVADAVEEIDELVAHSLVEPVRTELGVRYRLLEPVRQRAQQTLLSDPARASDAHLEHYLDRLEEAYEILGTSSCDPILNLLFHDLDNLRALHDWALESDRIDDDLRLYRPLLFAPLHEVFEIGDWAAAVASRAAEGEHETIGASYLSAYMTGSFRQSRTDDFARWNRLIMELPKSKLNQDYVAWAMAFSAAASRAVEEIHQWLGPLTHSADPSHRFLARFFELSYLSYWTTDLAVIRDTYAGSVSWTQGIGARNFEAGILEVAALNEVLLHEPEVAARLAAEAEVLAGVTGMGHVLGRSIEHQAKASLLRGRAPVDVVERVVTVLRTAVAAGNHLRLHHGLLTAARTCELLGDDAGAALARAAVPKAFRRQINSVFDFDDALIAGGAERMARDKLDDSAVAQIIAAELEASVASGRSRS